jgi:uncharacterized repeat protein (TIGR03803 family)
MRTTYRIVALSLTALGLASVIPSRAAHTIYKFKGGSDGKWSVAGLLESQGALYGTTEYGGTNDYGTVFKLTPPAKAGAPWSENVIYSFTGDSDGYDGTYPEAGLIVGSDGAFYGTTNGGGRWGYGTAYKLVPPADGQSAWSESVIYNFCSLSDCSDGTYPQDALLAGSDGALYGTTSEGGLFVNKGTVFKLTPPAGAGSAWSETVLYSFCSVGGACDDGSLPLAGLIADNQGSLYSTTEFGGSEDSGTAFKLTPPAKGQTKWTETVLHSFCIDYDVSGLCLDGKYPVASLVFDQQGALYGTASQGGDSGSGYDTSGGVVFKLTPPANGQTGWTETVPHSFTSHARGANPSGALIIDQQGALYGTTQKGGGPSFVSGSGVVFKLTPPPQSQYKWPLTVLFNLNNSTNAGYNPAAGLILYQDALYGTTLFGGSQRTDCIIVEPYSHGCGAVFKVTLSPESTEPRGDDAAGATGEQAATGQTLPQP